MQENICSIPINDVFIPKDGCPMCRMRDMLEERKADYITGSAMMEPGVRVQTNAQGFCFRHFKMMVRLGRRLPNALLIETHLQQISEQFIPEQPPKKFDKKKMEALDSLIHDCFICRDIKQNMYNMVRIVHSMWISEPEFKQLYAEQKFICLEHFYLLINTDRKGLGKNFQDFYEATSLLTGGYLNSLRNDVHNFCSMFDYHNADNDNRSGLENIIERSVEFLTGDRLPLIDSDNSEDKYTDTI